METDPWKVINDAWLKRYTWATVVIAAFTIVIASASIQQCRMYKANERPWVGPTVRITVYDKETNKVFGIQWKYANGGKSPALNLRFNLALKIGSPLKAVVDEIDIPSVERCKSIQPLPGTEGLMVMPGVEQIYLMDSTSDIRDSSESIIANRLGLYFVGCLDYEDVSGTNHRTNVCELYLPGVHLFMPCARGNSGN